MERRHHHGIILATFAKIWITADTRRDGGGGICIGRHRIRRVRGERGLKAIQPRLFVPRTTNSRHSLGNSPNLLLEMKLPPDRLPMVIVGDITYVALHNGKWCYMATWTDLFSRRILGWAIMDKMTEDLIIEAFLKLVRRVKLPAGCIIHSDRGGQYASKNFRQMLKLHGCRQSMSRAGETYDNAFAESLFSRYKAELLEGGAFSDTEEATMETCPSHRLLLQHDKNAFEHRLPERDWAINLPLTKGSVSDR